MSRPAAAVMAAAGLRLRVDAPRAAVEFDAVAAPTRGGPAKFTEALVEAGRQLTGDVRVVVVSGSTWAAQVPAAPFSLRPSGSQSLAGGQQPPRTQPPSGSDLSPMSSMSPMQPIPDASPGPHTAPGNSWPGHFLSGTLSGTWSGPGAGALGWLSGRPDLFSVAVLHGEVSGAGLDLALACDLRVGADDTRLTWQGAGAAGPPSGTAAADLVAAVGYARALEWSVVGTAVPAALAVELGLLTRAVPRAEVGAAADAVVDGLLAVPREVAVETKAALLAALPARGRFGD